jgi:hypothetical protein
VFGMCFRLDVTPCVVGIHRTDAQSIAWNAYAGCLFVLFIFILGVEVLSLVGS